MDDKRRKFLANACYIAIFSASGSSNLAQASSQKTSDISGLEKDLKMINEIWKYRGEKKPDLSLLHCPDLKKRIKNDFLLGATFNIDGLVLSRTEAEYCAALGQLIETGPALQ